MTETKSLQDIKHIAIIMDGNRRWAEKNKLKFLLGHRKGADVFENILRHCGEQGLEVLTVYAFSTENWRRDKEQVDDLLKLLTEFLVSKEKEIMANNVQCRIIGKKEDFPQDVRISLDGITEKTKDNTGIILNVALSYGGRDEIVRAVNKAVEEGEKVDEESFSSMLDTAGLPDPEIFIRTGGYKRISNFLLWQISYSELFFTDTLWPDFTTEEFDKIVSKYRGIKKNFGK